MGVICDWVQVAHWSASVVLSVTTLPSQWMNIGLYTMP